MKKNKIPAEFLSSTQTALTKEKVDALYLTVFFFIFQILGLWFNANFLSFNHLFRLRCFSHFTSSLIVIYMFKFYMFKLFTYCHPITKPQVWGDLFVAYFSFFSRKKSPMQSFCFQLSNSKSIQSLTPQEL